MKKVIEFLKKEAVLTAALLLAIISSFVVKPDKEYIEYVDLRTLAILFSLMCVMAGLQGLGVFKRIAGGLLNSVKSERKIVLILVMLCFFFSMLITNDVALITFVPFTFTTLEMLGADKYKKLVIPVVVLQTIAANLGSMLTPLGNPQNLYLYGKMETDFGSFVMIMLPYTVASLVLVVVSAFIFTRGKATQAETETGTETGAETATRDGSNRMTLTEMFQKTNNRYHMLLVLYLLLFIVALMTVVRVLPYEIMFFITLILVLIADRKTILKVDWSLLLTFVGFFVFIGNMGRVPAFSEALSKVITGRETWTAIVSSQVISNVPAALLLSGFTSDLKSLVIGTNLGGLGTLIASMASLISYKLAAARKDIKMGKYLGFFTVMNVVFLCVLAVLYVILS
ncbi:MAG: citrate transporter [Lachnospiraceae bacterium]|nr:citrate transporter [Lachnospiraceae bacterium]MBR5993659.1 citrate transporter [Lachnospiraceae bacterium]